MIFTDPVYTSIDSAAGIRRWLGHAAAVVVVFMVGFVMASPSSDDGFKKGFLVATTFPRTQEPFRPPPAGPQSLTPGEELGQLFQSSAIREQVAVLAPPAPVIALPPKSLPVARKSKITRQAARPLPTPVINQTPKIDQTPIDEDLPQAQSESLLTRVRKDPARIYIDLTIVAGDLSWTFRNASNEGIEFLVTNRNEAQRTYYLPKASTNGRDSIMEGGVVAPGQTVFGVIPGVNLRRQKELQVTLLAAGAPEKKVKVKLPW